MRLIRRLSPHEKNEILHLLESEVSPRLKRQEGKSYAAGRLCAWVGCQPDYGKVPRATSCPCGAIWGVLKRHVPKFELAECYLNAADGSSKGIKPHQDHTFAARVAWVINLGPTRFRIWMKQPNEPSAPGFFLVKKNKIYTEFAADLEGDEILEFDCKLMHSSETNAAFRWGVGLWTFNREWKEAAGLAP